MKRTSLIQRKQKRCDSVKKSKRNRNYWNCENLSGLINKTPYRESNPNRPQKNTNLTLTPKNRSYGDFATTEDPCGVVTHVPWSYRIITTIIKTSIPVLSGWFKDVTLQ